MQSAEEGKRWDLAWWVFFALVFAQYALRRGQPDFEAFYRAGTHVLEGAPLYPLEGPGFAFKYSPTAALFFAPLAVLPYVAANWIWGLLSAWALVSFLRWSRQMAGVTVRWSTPLVVALTFPFWSFHFFLGQSDMAILALLAASELEAPRRPGLSGALVAAASLMKPPALVLVGWALAQRQWRRVFAFLATLAVGTALPALRYGPAGLLDQLRGWRGLLAATTPEGLCSSHNQSLFAWACSFAMPDESPAYSVTVACGAAALVLASASAVYWVSRRSPAEAKVLALALVFYATAVLSPLGWRAGLVAIAPLLFFASQRLHEARSRETRVLATLALLPLFLAAVLTNETVGPAVFGWLLRARFLGLAALASIAGTVALRLRRLEVAE